MNDKEGKKRTDHYAMPDKAVLQTRSGEHVAVVSLPPFSYDPDLLIWGIRYFGMTTVLAKREGYKGLLTVYKELIPFAVFHSDEEGDVFEVVEAMKL